MRSLSRNLSDITNVFTETLWCQRTLDKREKELQWRIRENIISIVISFIWSASLAQRVVRQKANPINRIWVPSAMALFSFFFYTVVAGGRLTVSTTFTALSLLSQIRGPMMQLPDEFFAYLHGERSMIDAA